MNPGKLMGIWLGYYMILWYNRMYLEYRGTHTNKSGKKQGNLLDDDLQVNFHILMHSPISIILSGWCFQPLWLFPIYGKIEKCSKPPTRYLFWTNCGLTWEDFFKPWQKKLEKSFIMILKRVDHRKHWNNQSAGLWPYFFKAASPLRELVVIWNTSAILMMIPTAPLTEIWVCLKNKVPANPLDNHIVSYVYSYSMCLFLEVSRYPPFFRQNQMVVMFFMTLNYGVEKRKICRETYKHTSTRTGHMAMARDLSKHLFVGG